MIYSGRLFTSLARNNNIAIFSLCRHYYHDRDLAKTHAHRDPKLVRAKLFVRPDTNATPTQFVTLRARAARVVLWSCDYHMYIVCTQDACTEQVCRSLKVYRYRSRTQTAVSEGSSNQARKLGPSSLLPCLPALRTMWKSLS